MKFEWDPAKAEKNDEKYGVSFDEAVTIFKDPHVLFHDDDEHSQKEKRELAIGRSGPRSRLLTCFIARTEDTVRIISARSLHPQGETRLRRRFRDKNPFSDKVKSNHYSI